MHRVVLAGVVAAAVGVFSAGAAVAGIVYQFEGTVANAGADGPCDLGPCSVDGWMEVSTESFNAGLIDDPTDVHAFSFAISSVLGGFTLGLEDLWTVDLVVEAGGDRLTSGYLAAQRLVFQTTSVEFAIGLSGLGGSWSGEAESDPLVVPLAVRGSWLRVAQTVPEPGVLPLLLAGLGAAALIGRRRVDPTGLTSGRGAP